MDQSTLIALGGSILFVVLAYFLLAGETNTAGKRARSIGLSGGGNTENERTGLLSFLKPEDTSQRRKQIEDSLSKLESDQKAKKKQRKSLKAKLEQADWKTSPGRFSAISIIIGVIVGFLALMVSKNPLISAGVAFVVGFGLPRWFLNFVIGRRQKKFTSNFADAMDIIVRGVRTGLPLGDCLKIIAHESPEPLAGEFRRVVEGEAVGVPLETCLERMYERMPVPEVNFFSTVLNIQRTTGGNLGESLGNLSKVLRGRKLLREKIKALSAEAKMSAIIIGCLPIVVMVIVTIASPEYMSDLYYTERGRKNMVIGAVMMVMGTLVMKKMINFKI